MWVFPKIGYPQIIHFNRGFHYNPSILGYHYFLETPMYLVCVFQLVCSNRKWFFLEDEKSAQHKKHQTTPPSQPSLKNPSNEKPKVLRVLPEFSSLDLLHKFLTPSGRLQPQTWDCWNGERCEPHSQDVMKSWCWRGNDKKKVSITVCSMLSGIG